MKVWHCWITHFMTFYRTGETLLYIFSFLLQQNRLKQCTFETSIYIKIQSAPQVKILTEAYTFTACVNGKPHNGNNVTATSLPSSQLISQDISTRRSRWARAVAFPATTANTQTSQTENYFFLLRARWSKLNSDVLLKTHKFYTRISINNMRNKKIASYRFIYLYLNSINSLDQRDSCRVNLNVIIHICFLRFVLPTLWSSQNAIVCYKSTVHLGTYCTSTC